jgi:hypothetical protein
MPNWCDNSLTIEGPQEALQDFYEKNTSKETVHYSLSFNALVPLPEDKQEEWYEWHIEHWGTKWDVRAEDVHIGATPEEGSLFYGFDTAWGPAEGWVKAVAKLYPQLTFQLLYAESGAGFAGILECQEGQVSTDEVHSYGDDGYREFVIEHFGSDYLADEDEEDED